MQKQVSKIDRITLIYDDNHTRKIHGGRVRETDNGLTQVLVEARYVPREHIGMDLVAANSDGTVATSFNVEDMWMEGGTRVYSPVTRL